MTPIHHYYHIYADGAWEEPVREHTDALRDSGLEDYPSFLLHIGLVGSKENVRRVRDYLGKKNLEWNLIGWCEKGWEQLTLNAVAHDCKQTEGLVFYAHTKGAQSPSRFNTAWRKRMTYFNVARWKDAVARLALFKRGLVRELVQSWLVGIDGPKRELCSCRNRAARKFRCPSRPKIIIGRGASRDVPSHFDRI